LESINKSLGICTQCRIKPFPLYLSLECLPVSLFFNCVSIRFGEKIFVKSQKNVLVPLDSESASVSAFQISGVTIAYLSKSSCILEVYVVFVFPGSEHVNIGHFVKEVAIRKIELDLQPFPLILIQMGGFGTLERNDPHKDFHCLVGKISF
jgi:hypothetical protein